MRILITRPEPKASQLAELLQVRGVECVLFPALTIAYARRPRWVKTLLTQYQDGDTLLVTSPNAVTALQQGLAVPQWLTVKTWPMLAIGRGTAAALQQLGAEQVTVSAGTANSEGLLALPDLQSVAGRRFWLLRGNGGRELLRKTLQARGAEVRALTTYYRRRSELPIAPLLAEWRAKPFDWVVVTSVASLKMLWAVLGDEGRTDLQQSPITVLSQNMLRCAKAYGIKHTAWLNSAINADIVKWVESVVKWYTTNT